MAQRPVNRAPGEDLKLVGFKAPISLNAAIVAKAEAAGQTKSDWLRTIIQEALANEEVAA